MPLRDSPALPRISPDYNDAGRPFLCGGYVLIVSLIALTTYLWLLDVVSTAIERLL
jgi:hypothetical protein